MLAVDALARAVRFERAFIKQDRAAGAVRQDERDRVSGAPSYRLAGKELAVASNRMAAGFGSSTSILSAAIGLEPVLDVERPAVHAQCRIRADNEDGAAP